jgi:hypothetical protein
MSGGPETTSNEVEKNKSTGRTTSTNTLNSTDSSTGYTNTSSTSNPYGPTQGLLGNYIGDLGSFSPFSGDFSTQFGNVAKGFDQGVSNTIGQLAPYANGDFLDLQSNPYTKQIIDQITDSTRNNTLGAWSNAGREFSPGMAAALGKGTAEGLAPTLFNQFNTQQGLQQGAIGQTGNLLNQWAGGLSGLYGQQADAPYNGFQNLSNLLLPIASQFGTQTATSNTGSEAEKFLTNLMQGTSFGKGRSTGTGTSSTESDPFQTALGGGIGLLGLL